MEPSLLYVTVTGCASSVSERLCGAVPRQALVTSLLNSLLYFEVRSEIFTGPTERITSPKD